MVKIINRKKYDTETAELLHAWNNGIFDNDFRSCSEDLCRTKNGAFFLHGSGGPMSEYAVSYGNTTSGGQDIRPLSQQEAIDWLEGHDGEDAIIEHFSDQIEEA